MCIRTSQFSKKKANVHRKSMKIKGGSYTPWSLYPEKYDSVPSGTLETMKKISFVGGCHREKQCVFSISFYLYNLYLHKKTSH